MCDGTTCPCNLYEPGQPASRWPDGRPPRAPSVRRRALQVALWSALATIVWALLLAVTGWGFLNVLGPVSIVVCLVALLVAAVSALSGLGSKVAERHRAARRHAASDRT